MRRFYQRPLHNGKDLHLLRIDPEGELKVRDYPDLSIKGMNMIEAKGKRIVPDTEKNELYTEYESPKTEPVTLKFVPYYSWNNRG